MFAGNTGNSGHEPLVLVYAGALDRCRLTDSITPVAGLEDHYRLGICQGHAFLYLDLWQRVSVDFSSVCTVSDKKDGTG